MRFQSRTLVLGALGAGAVVSLISAIKVVMAHPEQLGIDLIAYVEAAERFGASGTPYAPILHEGPLANTSANIPNAYLYPPPIAQLFVVIGSLPMPLLELVWSSTQVVALALLLPAVFMRFGGTPDRFTLVAVLLAAVAFNPVVVAVYVGNVSGWIAILVAAMLVATPRVRGVLAAATAWIKLTPGGLLAGGVADRSTRIATIAAAIAIPALSFAIAPAAWADWVAVLPSSSGFYERAPVVENLAPSAALAASGLAPLADPVGIVLPLAFIALTVVYGWRGNAPAWVAAAVGAYLSATGTSWDHYFAALMPIGVAVWPGAPRRMRWLLVGVLAWLGPLRVLHDLAPYHLIALLLWVPCLFAAIVQLGGRLRGWTAAGSALGFARPSEGRS